MKAPMGGFSVSGPTLSSQRSPEYLAIPAVFCVNVSHPLALLLITGDYTQNPIQGQ